ncbi:MAG: hypothetical protein ACK5RK_15485 [Betaproteobacteria bacterium]
MSRRILFNELATLLGHLNPSALARLATEFPAFAAEIERGPDAGPAEEDRKHQVDRATFALALSDQVVTEVRKLTERTISRTASLSSSKLAVALIAGLGGVGTLGAFGLGKEDVVRVGGVVTSAIAVLNAALDALSKRYTSAEAAKAIDLSNAALGLSNLRNELTSLIKNGRSIEEIANATDKCNELALQLNARKEQLRLV